MAAVRAEIAFAGSIPPSALPISPTRGEIGRKQATPFLDLTTSAASEQLKVAQYRASPISHLGGEMPGRAERGAADSDEIREWMEWRR
jgi:hypothetical protein